ncbi:MAG: tRNA U34 5-methylaminomethyl-2-thiouridine-forming methyltransferase MnmC [Planctomycetota bacterium]|jgi:tRNA U34 5-methylaminomethyl-2-thiouridine-forming methyltransferase MnmC
MSWATELTADGSPTLVRPTDGVRMHSADGAWTQACLRYAAGVFVAGRLPRGRPFRLLDVGLGSGLNLAAALAWLEPHGVGLEAVSLELDPEGPRTALGWGSFDQVAPLAEPVCGPRLPDWRSWHGQVRAAVGALLGPETGPDRVPLGRFGGHLSLLMGDACDKLPQLAAAEPFDGVFLDPFAPAQEPELWQPAFARDLARVMGPEARLVTYSSSLTVRTSLAAAGLRVGCAPRVGGKAQGTMACCGDPAQPWKALEPRVQAKLRRRLERKIERTARGEGGITD